MIKENYKNRIIDKKIENYLSAFGAICIEGPKWCGKTWTSSYHCKSEIYLGDPSGNFQNRNLAAMSPSLVLEGETPRLIDEWQEVPPLWDAVRHKVDENPAKGQFILTGSSTPNHKGILHSGAGRIARIKMNTMSLYESGESNGTVSLLELFNNSSKLNGINELTLDDIAFLCCRGGWPRSVSMDKNIALEQAYDYYDAVVNSDISRVDNINRNPERTKNLMRSYARNIGSQASNETLKNDMINNDSFSLDTDTVLSYINALKKIFVVEESLTWNPNLRSKTAIRTSDTRYFIDPSIAVAALGLGPNDLINDLNTFGLIFESLCVRDLRVYAESINGSVYHYRDASDLECDAVIHLRDGSYGLIEIKLGGDKLINEGVESLLKLKNKIDIEKMKNPSFLLVLTATGKYSYKREDGVLVVPIGCLKN